MRTNRRRRRPARDRRRRAGAGGRRPGAIKISPERQQLIGVKFATVELSGAGALDPHGRQGHLRRDPRRARAHAHRRLDREGLRRLHGRRRQAGRADADDLQPGDAGVAAGAPARRAGARPDARQPAGVRRASTANRSSRRPSGGWSCGSSATTRSSRCSRPVSRSTASRCTRRPAAS